MEIVIKTKMTFHATHDRLDRLAACVEVLGVGETVLETHYNGKRFRLTDTGLCLVFAPDKELLITGYMCPVDRCVKMYHSSGYNIVPPAIYRTVVRNNKKYAFLLNM
jgi:hypothetical protein